MKGKDETITAENFAEYEKRVWMAQCRYARAKAGAIAGGIAGDIVLLLVSLGATFFFFPDEMPTSVLKPLVSFWDDVCNRYIPLLGALEREKSIFASVLAAIVIAMAADFLVGAVTGLLWPRGVDFTPLKGSAPEKAEALYDRFRAVKHPYAYRPKWYFKILPAVAYSAAIIARAVREALAEDGYIFRSDILAIAFVAIFLFLGFLVVRSVYKLLYVIFPPNFLLQSLSYKLYRHESLSSALFSYKNECYVQAREEAIREQERREAEEQRRREEEAERKRLMGDEIYREAVSGESVDEEQIAWAAKLGCRPACLFMGRKLMEEWAAGSYTKAEKEDIAERAKGYFRIAALEEDSAEARTEGTFGYLMFQCITESGNSSKWKNILSQLRNIRDSGLLPAHYNEPCAKLIDTVVDLVDSSSEKEALRTSYHQEPVVKRCYCKFFNAGICGQRSTAVYVAHCDHVSNPGHCPTALMDKGLGFVFE